MYLCACPELLGNKAVKIRRGGLHQVRNIGESAQIYEIGVIRIVCEHQVEILARIHNVFHLGVIVVPAGDLYVQPHTDLLLGVIADLCNAFLKVVGGCSAHCPIDQRRHFAAA